MGLRTRIAALAAGTAVLLTGCASGAGEKEYTRELYAMDTFMALRAYGENAQTALDEAAARINSLEQELSVTIADSDVSRINSAGGAPVSVGAETRRIIAQAQEISDQTDGALDITIYPLVKAWGFTTGEYAVPDRETIDHLLRLVDHSEISVSGENVTLPAGAEIDLGSVVKGYASDCAAEIMHGNGVSSGILNLGGNVCAIGSKPDGAPWKVAVASPFDSSEYLGILSVKDCFVITSGKYERYFTGDDGKRYHHIIDPATGYPSENGTAAVTVIGKSGIECDGLSTALLVMGEEKAVDYWREHGGFEMLLVTDDGRITATPGASEIFNNTSQLTLDVVQ